MDYKSIIRSRKVRMWILSVLSWIPDTLMVRLQYKIHTGRTLDLKHPQRFTEKLQLYKLRYRNPLMLRCTDKYEVRKVVEEAGLSDILIPLIGVYDHVKDIDFGQLPKQFVAKTTDGGGGCQVLLCRDKAQLDEAEFRRTLEGWMRMPKQKPAGREWAYENGYPRRIVIEQLITDGVHRDLPDYKFFCFEGEPCYCQVIRDRNTRETIDFYDMEWRHQEFVGINPVSGQGLSNGTTPVERPKNLSRMAEICRRLSKGYPFARVDLYETSVCTYFGEITFYPASGYGCFTPDGWDNRLGELMKLPSPPPISRYNILINNDIQAHSVPDSLIDYKFFCFSGRVEYVYAVSDRKLGQGAQLGIYSRDFLKLPAQRLDERPQTETLPRPPRYEEMVEIAERLARPFPHARIDLYNVNGGVIYFGEITFYDGSGYMAFQPDGFDFELGRPFDVSSFS